MILHNLTVLYWLIHFTIFYNAITYIKLSYRYNYYLYILMADCQLYQHLNIYFYFNQYLSQIIQVLNLKALSHLLFLNLGY